MEGFVGEEEEFIGDVELDRKPVEVDESGGDVRLFRASLGASNRTSCRVQL